MKNEILNTPNELNLDTSFDEEKRNKTEKKQITDESYSLNIVPDNFNNEENKLNNDIDTTINCLALSVREYYHLTVVKNFFKKTFRVSWKVALSMFTINFLNMFL